MGDRRKAREAALQILFQEDFNTGGTSSSLLKDEKDPDIIEFRDTIVKGVLSGRDQIDQLIEKHTENWSTNRIAAVDHNVLRIAIFEMVFLKDTHSKVVMDEAIEIAKKYGNEHSGKFVNGILDSIHQAQTTAVGALND